MANPTTAVPPIKTVVPETVQRLMFLRSHPAWQALCWVARAKASCHGHYAIAGVSIEKGAICATNGHALHFIECSHDLPLGLYRPRFERQTLILETGVAGKYPAWRDVIPTCDNTLKRRYAGDKNEISLTIARLGKIGVAISSEYLSTALSYHENFTVAYGKPNRAIRIDFEPDTKAGITRACAVLMPIEWEQD